MARAQNRATRPPGSPSSEALVTTCFLIANLHCPTCVSTIKNVIHESCAERVRWVSPNVVTSVVTVEHEPEASIADMQSALEDAGFEVSGATTSAGAAFGEAQDLHIGSQTDDGARNSAERGNRADGSWPALGRWMSAPGKRPRSHVSKSDQTRTHIENCEQCRNLDGKHDVEACSPGGASPARFASTSTSKPEPSGSSKQMASKSFVTVVSDETSTPPAWRATLAIGGMTCAACVNTITDELKKQPWVSSATVNLVTNSGVFEISGKEKVDDLLESIEDLGYEATLDSIASTAKQEPRVRPNGDAWRVTLAVGGMTCAACVNTITDGLDKRKFITKASVNLVGNSATVEFEGKDNLDAVVEAIEDLGYDATVDSVVSLTEEKEDGPERTVEILIEGLYCAHCPDRVANSLAGFRRQLDIITPPTHKRPIIKIAYIPEAPTFTVRQILAAIDASDPAFKTSIYHPPTLEERSKQIQRRHQLQILYRVIFAGIVCIPTFILGVVYMSLVPDSSHSKHFLMQPWTSGISRAQMALFIMATPVYFFAADIFHVRAFKEIRALWRRGSRTPVLQRFYRFGSMNTLMSLGTTIAYISSVSQLIAAAAYRADTVNNSNFYFDSVVFLTFFLLVGRLIESYSKSKTGDAVEMLGRLRPTTAVLVEGRGTDKERDETVKADLLDFGDIVRIVHGASPPADGVIVQGDSASFDESSLTGESRPVKKSPGDAVFAGTINKDTPVLVRITGVGGRSMLDQIVAAVREGQAKRAPMEQIADLLTTYFVPAVTLIAVLTWIIWLSLGLSGRIPYHFLDVSSGGWVAFSLQFAIAVFVVACPCGLALAAPTAIFVGGGIAAKQGILAKGGGEAFEKASRVDCVVFDKTGTLTQGGEPKITDFALYGDGADEEEEKGAEGKENRVLGVVRAVEENSSHPIAKAIVGFCAEKGAKSLPIEDLQELPGKGLKAVYLPIDGKEGTLEVLVGNEALMKEYAVTVSQDISATLQKWKTEAKSVALVAVRSGVSSSASSPNSPATSSSEWSIAATFSISDPIRPEAPAIIRALHAAGTRVWMLSGDNPTTATAVAAQLGIPADQVIAGVLPTEKAAQITYLQSTLKARNSGFFSAFSSSSSSTSESTSRRATVAMVGDGINDAPALATADVGVAVGSGSDVAISSAAFVLVSSDLRSVVALLDLSRAVFRRIVFNFGWALVYNVVAVPIAAGVLYPIESGGNSGGHVRLDPVWASLAMALSSISVVTSSLALRSRIPGLGFRAREIKE